jgi:hypothetical protein
MGCSKEDSSVPAQTGRRKNTTENKNTETALADKTLKISKKHLIKQFH